MVVARVKTLTPDVTIAMITPARILRLPHTVTPRAMVVVVMNATLTLDVTIAMITPARILRLPHTVAPKAMVVVVMNATLTRDVTTATMTPVMAIKPLTHTEALRATVVVAANATLTPHATIAMMIALVTISQPPPMEALKATALDALGTKMKVVISLRRTKATPQGPLATPSLSRMGAKTIINPLMAAHPRDTANRLLGTEEATIRMVEMRRACRSPAVMVVERLIVPLATDAILPGTKRVRTSNQGKSGLTGNPRTIVVVIPSIIAVGGKKPQATGVREVIKAERKAVDMAASSKNTVEAAMKTLLELRGLTLAMNTGEAKSAVITTNTKRKIFSVCTNIHLYV
jgi:hypothetical protein